MDEINEETFVVPWTVKGDLELNILGGIAYLVAEGVSMGLDSEDLDRMKNWLDSRMHQAVIEASRKPKVKS